MRLARTFALAACLTYVVHAQSRRELLGKLVKGDDQSQTPFPRAKVVLDEAGSHAISDDDGLFHLFLPDVFRPGDEITISVTVPGYAIYEPPGGKLTIPSDIARKRKVIQLLPKGSPKFKSDAQLRALLEAAAREPTRQPAQPKAEEHPDPERYLKDWAAKHGFQRGRSSCRAKPVGRRC